MAKKRYDYSIRKKCEICHTVRFMCHKQKVCGWQDDPEKKCYKEYMRRCNERDAEKRALWLRKATTNSRKAILARNLKRVEGMTPVQAYNFGKKQGYQLAYKRWELEKQIRKYEKTKQAARRIKNENPSAATTQSPAN